MPTFPCDKCDKTFGNMVQLKQHKLSQTCTGDVEMHPEAPPSSSQLPPYEFNFFTEGKPVSVDAVNCARVFVEGIHHSAGGLGSLGVFFLNLKHGGGVVVLKQGSLASSGDYFASLLFKRMGIKTPAIRILRKQEFKDITKAMAMVPCTEPGAADNLQEARAQSGGAVLMEFSKGCTLKDPRVADALKDPAKASGILYHLGEIIAVDMVINNFDRTPMVWAHQGNANNILFDVSQDPVIVTAIDQCGTAIQNRQLADDYIGRVREAVAEAVRQDDSGPYITKVKDFVRAYAGDHDIGPAGCHRIQQGIVDCAKKIAAFKGFAGLFEDTFQAFTSCEWGALGLIDVSFFEAVLDAMSESLP